MPAAGMATSTVSDFNVTTSTAEHLVSLLFHFLGLAALPATREYWWIWL